MLLLTDNKLSIDKGWFSDMWKVEVRKMKPGDKESIRQICCETGFGGKHIEVVFSDEAMFADMVTLYYTDYEPQSAFVARFEGETVGYLTGCLDTRSYNRVMKSKIVPRILLNVIRRQYCLNKKNRRYLKEVISHLLKGKTNLPLENYPAHLHINIRDGFRGFGIGRELISRYLVYLSDNNIKGVHLVTTSLHQDSLSFYEKLGFEIYARSETYSLGSREIYDLIYVRSVIISS